MHPVDKVERQRLNGKKWSFTCRVLTSDRWAECDFGARIIAVSPEAPDEKLCELLTHEVLHAATSDLLSEECVTEVGSKVAKVLKAAGILKGRYV